MNWDSHDFPPVDTSIFICLQRSPSSSPVFVNFVYMDQIHQPPQLALDLPHARQGATSPPTAVRLEYMLPLLLLLL